jgi:hypothetical protein
VCVRTSWPPRTQSNDDARRYKSGCPHHETHTHKILGSSLNDAICNLFSRLRSVEESEPFFQVPWVCYHSFCPQFAQNSFPGGFTVPHLGQDRLWGPVCCGAGRRPRPLIESAANRITRMASAAIMSRLFCCNMPNTSPGAAVGVAAACVCVCAGLTIRTTLAVLVIPPPDPVMVNVNDPVGELLGIVRGNVEE